MTKDRATEIREAIDAADAALKHLGNAADMLDDAGRWGIVDMLGGGLITTLLKHRKISDAQDEIDEAKHALRIFVKELDDVDEATGLNVELGSGLQFADIFFDGVLADWIAQNKIDRAKQQVADAMRQVYAVRSQLERMH
ncbi:MAG: hypothetical protein SOX20_00670 [Parolsenella sp.]|uniref:hypothetical protein n=1 Tax=Parolsenella sp. TaxID=2083006 RepID=UPI002A75A934|nr:hypothetical protein [Parolsenella sp.]MCI5949650.1 hypothetical protein [Coriobacteriaceae bacterium]MDY3291435.1 hypothetical protein [Parolsenella sp.]